MKPSVYSVKRAARARCRCAATCARPLGYRPPAQARGLQWPGAMTSPSCRQLPVALVCCLTALSACPPGPNGGTGGGSGGSAGGSGGSGGGGSSTGVPVDQLCQRSWEAQCDMFARCGDATNAASCIAKADAVGVV